jgi:hypothetical protein
LILEHYLGVRGKTYNVICHVVRSFADNSLHEGKLLVFHGKPPKETKSDGSLQLDMELKGIGFTKETKLKLDGNKIELEAAGPADYTIYKPLGSPLLHDPSWVKTNLAKISDTDPGQDLELDSLDSTVITEEDLRKFLSRLEHEGTGTPVGIKRLLDKQPSFVAGYALDQWNYRFAMQVFHSAGSRQAHLRNLAARIPKESPMEMLAWQGLATDLIAMEPNDFAKKVLTNLQLSVQAKEEVSHAS